MWILVDLPEPTWDGKTTSWKFERHASLMIEIPNGGNSEKEFSKTCSALSNAMGRLRCVPYMNGYRGIPTLWELRRPGSQRALQASEPQAIKVYQIRIDVDSVSPCKYPIA